jgi:uncharacterized protein (DUF1800 family)
MRSKVSAIHKMLSVVAFVAMFSPVFNINVSAQQMMMSNTAKNIKNAGKLSEDQRILHVLNRLGFGARPGDVEKVKAIGLQKYIEQQLNPDSINDPALAAKMKNFDVMDMETSEVFAKYPNPGALIRQLEGNGRKKRQNAQNNQNNNDDAMMNDEKSQQEQSDAKRDRRQKLTALYQKYDLKPANQISIQVNASRIVRAVYSEKQLQEEMVDFWANHFNVYDRKAATRWYIPSYERDVLRKNALGNFKDLVIGTAKHPAMLFYLDNFQSTAENTNANQNQQQKQRLERLMNNPRAKQRFIDNLKQRGMTDEQIKQRFEQLKNGGNQQNRGGINENYARELMELHTLGVDGGYTQNDIKEVAKAFTGWTIFDARGYRKAAAKMIKDDEQDRQLMRQARNFGISPDTESGTFIFVDRLHDQGTKTVLGQKINEGGMKDGLKVIDILVSQPSTAKFIAKKLAVKFVNDNPSEELVNRIAQAFQKSNGDIKTTLRALFSSPEFYAPENYRAKIKTPFELLASSLRVLDADTTGNPALVLLLRSMGEQLYGYQAPTGYPDTAADWVNTGALLQRMNFAVALASNRIPQTRVNLQQFEAKNQSEILNKAIDKILNGEVSSGTKSTLLKQLEKPLIEPKLDDSLDDDDADDSAMMMQGKNNRRNRGNGQRLREPSGNPDVFKIVGLIIGSPEFQRQ